MKNLIPPQLNLSFLVLTKPFERTAFKKNLTIFILVLLAFSVYSFEEELPLSNELFKTFIHFTNKNSGINDSLFLELKERKSIAWEEARYFTPNHNKIEKISNKNLEEYPFDIIIVPGYTPRNGIDHGPKEKEKRERKGKPDHIKIEGRKDAKQSDEENPCYLHGDAIIRLQIAIADYVSGKAPLIMVSGGNVWPEGTQCYEAIMMKNMLISMGVPEDKIIVDDKARHSTTNLRNAGRYMLSHGMKKALVTTSFGQDFYFSHPLISSFTFRSIAQMGLRIGKLRNPKRKEWWSKVVGKLKDNKTAVLLKQRAGKRKNANHSVFEPKESVFLKGLDLFDL